MCGIMVAFGHGSVGSATSGRLQDARILIGPEHQHLACLYIAIAAFFKGVGPPNRLDAPFLRGVGPPTQPSWTLYYWSL